MKKKKSFGCAVISKMEKKNKKRGWLIIEIVRGRIKKNTVKTMIILRATERKRNQMKIFKQTKANNWFIRRTKREMDRENVKSTLRCLEQCMVYAYPDLAEYRIHSPFPYGPFRVFHRYDLRMCTYWRSSIAAKEQSVNVNAAARRK